MFEETPKLPDSPASDPIAPLTSESAPARPRMNYDSPRSIRTKTLLKIVWNVPAQILIGIVRIYQKCLSPFLGNNCRFHPSCSQYFILAVRKYGAARGALRGAKRILRCHPWNPGGFDPP